MTPQERQSVTELFERLATLEGNRRDPEAASVILAGLQRAPNAVYALVQSVLVQGEALRQAEERIRALEGGQPAEEGSFLDTMRDSLFGGRSNARGSVPSVRPGTGEAGGFQAGRAAPEYQAQAPGHGQTMGQGGSFLGTAAAAAVGIIGGTMLMNSLRSAMGGEQQKSSMFDSAAGNSDKNPWSGKSGDSDLSRQAGIDDIGRDGRLASGDGAEQRAGLFDVAENDSDDFNGDFDIGGDSDLA
jgi:hypothetical protein